MPLKKSQRSLKDWGKQKWRTSSGNQAKVKKDIYLTQHGNL